MTNRQIYNATAERFLEDLGEDDNSDNDDILAKLPTQRNVTAALNYKKRKHLPPVTDDPATLEFPQEMTVTKQNKPYLQLYETAILAGGVIATMLVFFNKKIFKFMCQAARLFMDGTFKMCPRQFAQFYTLHYFIPGTDTMIPAVFALLTHKSEQIYTRLFNFIVAKAAEYEVDINWTSTMTDFELATVNAIHASFEGVQTVCCNFHFCQAVYRHMAELGLSTLFKKSSISYSEDFNIWFRKLLALAFLPVDRIAPAFAWLVTVRPFALADPLDLNFRHEKINQLLVYFRDNWVKDGSRFAKDWWSVFELDDHRTNNNIEGWHNGILTYFKSPSIKPGLWRFVDFLKDENSHNLIKIAQVRAGTFVTPVRPKVRAHNKSHATLKRQYVAQRQLGAGLAAEMDYVNHVADITSDTLFE